MPRPLHCTESLYCQALVPESPIPTWADTKMQWATHPHPQCDLGHGVFLHNQGEGYQLPNYLSTPGLVLVYEPAEHWYQGLTEPVDHCSAVAHQAAVHYNQDEY